MTGLPPVFDGHNDSLSNLVRRGLLPQDWMESVDDEPGLAHWASNSLGHLDYRRAVTGRFGGGFFAISITDTLEEDVTLTPDGWAVSYPEPIDPKEASARAEIQIQLLLDLAMTSDGKVEIIRTVGQLRRCLESGVIGAVMHFEGAEPIAPDLSNLDVLYRLGLRSVGPTWSRANAFGYGVPQRWPASPDLGPGLTDAGTDLIHRCNELGILVDVSHMTEAAFWDVERTSSAPIVATHSCCHALSPHSRNLTDAQIDAVGRSGGLIGLCLDVPMLRSDGRPDDNTPLTAIVEHAHHITERIGVDHVAFGSDLDGALLPREMKDATGFPAVLNQFRLAGYGEAELRQLAYENWLRVLAATWK